MKRLFVPASTENDESATYNVIVYKGQGKDAKILYQTVKNDGDEILKNIGKKRRIKKNGANSNGQISTYTVNGQILEEYGLNLLFCLITRTPGRNGWRLSRRFFHCYCF